MRQTMRQTMATYQPTSRRPIAGLFRATAGGAVRFCLLWGVHADAVSYASMAAAAGAAICFWRAGERHGLLLVGPAFCYLRLWCNMLDGMVALASGKASPRGEILNDLPDRVSDVLIFAGVAHGGLCHPPAAYWAIILALMTAYVGTFGQAVGARRQFGGMMSKPWRMVALHAGAWAAYASLRWGGGGGFAGLTVLDWTCLVVAAGCVQTIWVRLARILRALKEKASAHESA